MKKPKNPEKTCRICGGRCKANIRFCTLCAVERKRSKATERGGRNEGT